MIFNLRGTNGTGKSTVAHHVIKKSGAEPLEFWPNTRRPKPKAYGGEWKGVPIAILGSYETVCGGMDTITSIYDARDLIIKYAEDDRYPIVFYEGLFISHCMGTIAAALDEGDHKDRVIMAYLDTPLDECLRRVYARREERGNTRPFKEQNVIDDFQRVDWNRAKATREGWNTYWVDHTNAIRQVEQWLNAGAKNPDEPRAPRAAKRVQL